MAGLGKALGFGGLTDFVDPRRNMLLGLSAGFLSGDLGNVPLYAAEGRKADDAYVTAQKAKTERQQQLNQTVQWLQQTYPDLAGMVDAGMPVGEAWSEALRRQSPQQGGDANYGLTPIYGVDANGNPTIGQLSNQGGMQQVQMPEGFHVAKDPIKMDAGTHFVLLDPVTRQQIGIIPKNGDIPTGFSQTGDGSIAPMPGSDQDLTRRQELVAAESRVRLLDERTDHVVGAVDKALGQTKWDTTGLVGAVTGAVPGMSAYDLRKTIDAIKANIGFSELQAMREASPTGGALGQVAVQELNMLQSVLGSLDANQSTEQLAATLATIKQLLERQKQYRQQASAMPGYGGSSAVPAASGGNTTSTGVTWSVGP